MNWIADCQKLKTWFLKEKRDLPWRSTSDPYAIWISEVMLQQTQVAVVIPYYERWLQKFPTIQALADAPKEDVIKAWEGLGYYSRARALHEGAQYIALHFNGQLPDNEKQLAQIKGIGPYTVGAILSFAFHKRHAAVDGNVMRVLARYLKIEEDIAKLATQKKMRVVTQNLLPQEEPWIINEALIELGATICKRKALCLICPLREGCESARHGLTDRLPIKSKGAKVQTLYRVVTVVQYQDKFLVKKGKPGEIMSDLYEFPFFETDQKGLEIVEIQKQLFDQYTLQSKFIKQLIPVEHGFTRYQVFLSPFLFSVDYCTHDSNFEWLSLKELEKRPFSSGHRRLLQQIVSDSLIER